MLCADMQCACVFSGIGVISLRCNNNEAAATGHHRDIDDFRNSKRYARGGVNL